MADFKIYILILQVFSGLLMVGLAVPLVFEKIGPNDWYGFRVRRTMEDPAVWYKANAYAGKSLIWVGIVIVVASLILYPVIALDPSSYAIACAGVTLTSLAVSVVTCFRFLGHLTRSTDR